jgi:hypothetical protein
MALEQALLIENYEREVKLDPRLMGENNTNSSSSKTGNNTCPGTWSHSFT